MIDSAYIEDWFRCEVVERHLKAKYWSKIRPGEVVLDVGAAWGCYTFPAAETGAYVYAFEPRVDAAYDLSESLRKRGLNEMVVVIALAVTDKPDQLVSLTNEVSRASLSSVGTLTAKTTTIDETIARYKISRVDWLKMDIEGAEIMALNGASETIRRFKPKTLIECHVGKDPNMANNVRDIMLKLCPWYQEKVEHNWLDWLGSYHLFYTL